MRYFRRRRRARYGLVRAGSSLAIGVFELSVTVLALLGSVVLFLARLAISRCQGRPMPSVSHEPRYALAVLGLLPLLLLSAVAGGGGPRPAPPSRAIPTAASLDPAPIVALPTPASTPENERCCDEATDGTEKTLAEVAKQPRSEVATEAAAQPKADPTPVTASAPQAETRQGPSEQRLRDLNSTIKHRKLRSAARAAWQQEELRRMMLPSPSAGGPAAPPGGHHGTCTGSTPCRACSNCTECRHCKSGGRCGVCAH